MSPLLCVAWFGNLGGWAAWLASCNGRVTGRVMVDVGVFIMVSIHGACQRVNGICGPWPGFVRGLNWTSKARAG